MVVGQHHRRGVDPHGSLHHLPDGDPRGVGAAPAHLLAAQELALGIQAEQKHRLRLSPEKPGHQILGAAFQGGQHLSGRCPVHHIHSSQLGHQVQQQRRALPHPGHLGQFPGIRLQDLTETAKVLQQGMGGRVGIRPGDGIEQQQLQSLHIRKAVQPLLQEPFFESLSVSLVHNCLLFGNLSCHFRKNPVQ